MHKGSPACPRCGRKKKYTRQLLACLVVLQAGAIGSYMHFSHPHMPTIVLDPAEAAAPVIAQPVAGWFYFETHDELVHDTTKHARVLSLSNPGASNPHDNGATGLLELRASPTYGSSVVITLAHDPGDIVNEQCILHARFDAGQEQVYIASGTTDSKNTTLIVTDIQGFTGQLTGAHTLSLVAELSAKSERAMNFEVGGLIWN